jgi:uncharacterized protein (TIGR03437 family)
MRFFRFGLCYKGTMNRLLAGLLWCSILAAQPVADPFRYRAPVKAEPARPAWASLPAAPIHALSFPDLTLQPPDPPGLTSTGLVRPLSGELTLSEARKGSFRAAVRSPGAAAVRVKIDGFAGGTLWVHDESGELTDGPYTDRGPFGDGSFWTGSVPGDTVVLEFFPAGNGDRPSFRVDSIGHFWVAPFSTGRPAADRRLAANCHIDFRCEPDWRGTGSSVASYNFVRGGSFFVCSGALLNSTSQNKQPYFLTAAHCVDSDTSARTIEAYWLYESPSCNAPGPESPRGFPRVVGGRVLSTARYSGGDYSFLLLNAFPTADVTLAGWSAASVPAGRAATGVHHPDGSYKRISFGQTANAVNTIVGGELAPASRFVRVLWSRGITEPGSSGSPVFDQERRLIGALSHGPGPPPGGSYCDVDPARDSYGRFSEYFPDIERWLMGEPAPDVTVSPDLLSFGGVAGTLVEPAAAAFEVRTASSQAVVYSVRASAPWIRLTAATGTTIAGNPATVSVSIDAASLSTPVVHTGTITVEAGAATPRTVSVRVAMAAGRSAVVIEAVPNPVVETDPNAAGQRYFFDLRLRETAGISAIVRQVSISGQDYSDRIFTWFGTSRVPALGSLTVRLATRGQDPPFEDLVAASGVDQTSGLPWAASGLVRYVGRGQAAPVFSGASIVNAASFAPGLAPGGLFTIFGQNLAAAEAVASTQPLPTALQGATVRANGVPCPLYYVSPGQINAQLPYGVGSGPVPIVVETSAGSQTAEATVSGIAPGLFLLDGTRPTPDVSGRPGEVRVAFITGAGAVSPAIASGAAPPPQTPIGQLPAPVAAVRVLVGGRQADIAFAGIPWGVIGAVQINYVVPAGLAPGPAPLRVEVAGQPSNEAVFTVLP